MILEAFQAAYPGVLSWYQFHHLVQSFSVSLLAVAGFSLFLGIWRWWKFSILPRLHPKDPREIPYWIPGLGHTISFLKNAEKVVEYGMKFTKRSREPFALSMLSGKLYILTSPEDVDAAYKNTTTLSWDDYLNDLLKGFGVRGEALKLAWHRPTTSDASYMHPSSKNFSHKSLVHFIEEIYLRQLLPGPNLNVLGQSYLARLDDTLRWDRIEGSYMVNCTRKQKRLSLKMFCRNLMIDAITSSLFGGILQKIEPNVAQDMITFNDYAWLLVFGCPDIVSPELAGSRKRLTAALRIYMDLPEDQREGEAFAIRNVLAEQKVTGIDDKSRLAMLLMIYWAANSNTVNLLFWMLTYLIFDPSLLAAIKKETQRAIKNEELDVKCLLEECSLLTSMFHEVLRLVNGALSIRKVVAPTEMSGKVLQPGNTVACHFRQLHFNEHVWGQDASRFDPERFLRNKKLSSNASYRPFGGGVSQCPGRYMAKIEVMGFIALLLHRFDLELSTFPEMGFQAKDQVFPKLDETTPSTGITGPVHSMDVFIEVRQVTS
ncbi:hypothetical protein MMC07_004658 [Pseudocyphellaria aurata]|nr:hypothetical protein [Pseudocyphellaria aurata]